MAHTVSSTRRRALGWSAGLAAAALLVLLSFSVGSRPIPLSETYRAFTDYDPTLNTHLLVHELRVPRTLLAIVCGAALGLAGALMQALTRNPLAEPGLLGVNAGAAAAVAIGLWMGASTPSQYVWFGFAGAAAATVVVYLIGRAHDAGTNPVRLVLAGAGLSVMLLATTNIVIIAAGEEVHARFAAWATGSLQGRGYDVIPWVAGACLLAAAVVLPLARSLDSMALGADLGTALGLRVRTTWVTGSIAVLLLAGAATAAAGPIGFLGLAAPHVARMLTGPAHQRLLPLSMLLGSVLLLTADVLGRAVAIPAEIGAGVMSAFVGAPFFIALARRRKLVKL